MEYVEGICRNEPDAVRSHLYAKTEEGLFPMCGYGWNRSNGKRWSIFRGHRSEKGTCKLCLKNVKDKKSPVVNGWIHKTKWI